MSDPFQSTIDSPISPAQNCFAIVPSDTQDLALVTKSIYVGQGGHVTILPLRGDTPVTFRNLPDASLLDVRARKILATGTTAVDMVGLA